MQVLLLNNTYEPIKIISWKKAVILYFKKKVDIIEVYEDRLLHSEKLVIEMPAVVKLNFYVNVRKYQMLSLSKENIFFRDNYTCLYCGKKLPKSYLTLDHVIPFSKGGEKTWKNLVTACHTCNNKKGDRLLHQIELKLLKKPAEPSLNSYLAFHTKFHSIPDKWKIYLPMEKKLFS